MRLSLAKPCDVFNAGAVPWEPAAGGGGRGIFPGHPFTVGEHNYLVLNLMNERKKIRSRVSHNYPAETDTQLPCWPNRSEQPPLPPAGPNERADLVLVGSLRTLELDSPTLWEALALLAAFNTMALLSYLRLHLTPSRRHLLPVLCLSAWRSISIGPLLRST